MGNGVVLHLTLEESPIVARVDPRVTFRMGEPAALVFDRARLHAFDPETDLSLTEASSVPS
jgi:ABC-type sugar transport system ATPase subunit